MAAMSHTAFWLSSKRVALRLHEKANAELRPAFAQPAVYISETGVFLFFFFTKIQIILHSALPFFVHLLLAAVQR